MPMIALDQIHAPPAPVRRHAASPAQEEALRDSIAAQGLLVPVLLRPDGNGYVLVAGVRRLRAVRALGHDTIAAHVLELLPQQHEVAAAAAENMVRAGMDPLDQWRVIVDLQSEGYTLAHAAACLGLSERAARRLDKLGRLHPDIIALIERFGLPEDHELGTIASAPTDVQARAAKADQRTATADAGDIDWWRVASACKTTRIARRHALFDPGAETVPWEEDLFAEAGDEDAVYTSDVAGFIAAQKRALAGDVAARKAKKQRVEIATSDKNGNIKLPKGFSEIYGNPEKPKKTETVFMAVAEGGYHLGEVVRAVAAKAAEKAGKGKDKKGTAAQHKAQDDDDTPPATASSRPMPDRNPEPAEPEQRDPISAAGRDAIARAKTEALVAHLTDTCGDRSLHMMLAFFVLALGARTVHVWNGPFASHGQRKFHDLAARLVPPEGAAQLVVDDIRSVAAEALTRMLVVPGAQHELDPAVEWIGQASDADQALPRFDTPEFLAHVSGAELRRLAVAAQLKPAKIVAGLREQLAGALPDWRPAVFGMPGPKETSP